MPARLFDQHANQVAVADPDNELEKNRRRFIRGPPLGAFRTLRRD